MEPSHPEEIEVKIAGIVKELEPQLIALRRDIHAHPELGFDTVRTAEVVAKELERLGYQPQRGIGKTGIVLDIHGEEKGPNLLLRADMDALPIEENTGLPFASVYPGKMHACGHDLHTATLLGVAATLKELQPQLKGSVRLVFQPAEETTESGAAAMIADGAAEGQDMAITFHNRPELAAGNILLTRGASTASCDEFDVVVTGVSGHAARPHAAADPIVATAYLITQLQTIISREMDPAQSAVLTVGHIEGGAIHNIIPDSCLFRGTVRARSTASRDHVETAFRRICAGVALSMNVKVDINYQRGVPPLLNDDRMVDLAEKSITRQFSKQPEIQQGRSFGAEDFSYFSDLMPACQIHIGSGQPGRDDHVHNSDYQPDESCISLGAIALTRLTLDILS
ncbi:M20 family metallopeptidase [Pantoea sp. BAV 3049]|uniref:M20 metallopeptidase family protein n=1 Tax=Pantoea sp. BAV 3049 TaxID=2654188 RepID=UPI00131B7DBF|nr:M20 family metallopeptidase [Pantoea sp. BAV 3049]